MKRSHKKRHARLGTETGRVLTYALAGVAEELSRLLDKYRKRHRREARRRANKFFQRHFRKMFYQAFSTALLNGPGEKAAKQRNALSFVLAAASVPTDLRLSGVPAELKRARRRRGQG